MNTLPEYASTVERGIVSKLLDLCLVNGNKVSIYDGEEYAIKRSTNKKAILKEMAATGEDSVLVRDAENVILGKFYLIYGNDEDIISDYIANEYCDKIAAHFYTY